MTESQSPEGESVADSSSSEALGTPIRRDPAFIHIAADTAIVMDLGRDIEIAFLRISPQPIAQRRSPEQDGVEDVKTAMMSYNAEVCRIRMSPHSAVNLAMTTLQKLAEEGHLNTDALRKSIDVVVASAPTEGDDA